MNQICSRCVMDTSDESINFDEFGVCDHCHTFDLKILPKWKNGENREQELQEIIHSIKKKGEGSEFDCILGMSGGVDSTYLLHKAVTEFGLRPLVFHVDGGWNTDLAVENIENIVNKLNEPFVLKQCSEGSSIGIFMIESREQYSAHFSEIVKNNDWIIAEQFMKGDEYTSTYLNGKALPIVKIKAKNHEFYDYEAKYLSDETEYICPCELDEEIEMAINNECEKAFKLFNVKGWGRLDFFLDEASRPLIL